MNIASYLQSKFPDSEISFFGEDCRSKVLIISSQFEGLNTLDRHRLIMSSLKEKFQSGELHALSIDAKTPTEV